MFPTFVAGPMRACMSRIVGWTTTFERVPSIRRRANGATHKHAQLFVAGRVTTHKYLLIIRRVSGRRLTNMIRRVEQRANGEITLFSINTCAQHAYGSSNLPYQLSQEREHRRQEGIAVCHLRWLSTNTRLPVVHSPCKHLNDRMFSNTALQYMGSVSVSQNKITRANAS